MSDHYIYPGELAALLAFVFAPALLVAFVAQAFVFAKRGIFRTKPSRAFVALAVTAIVSVAAGTAVLLLAPPFEPLSVLGLTDIRVAGVYWPVLPLAFVSVGVVAPIVGWWAARAEYQADAPDGRKRPQVTAGRWTD